MVLAFGICSVSLANEFRTQDNVNYIFAIADNISDDELKSCMESIQALAKSSGTGDFEYFSIIGSGVVNLSARAAEDVRKMSCVLSLEVDSAVEIPRVIRNSCSSPLGDKSEDSSK